jgi:hypothetical protein
VAGCCECGDEPSVSCATELVSYVLFNDALNSPDSVTFSDNMVSK